MRALMFPRPRAAGIRMMTRALVGWLLTVMPPLRLHDPPRQVQAQAGAMHLLPNRGARGRRGRTRASAPPWECRAAVRHANLHHGFPPLRRPTRTGRSICPPRRACGVGKQVVEGARERRGFPERREPTSIFFSRTQPEASMAAAASTARRWRLPRRADRAAAPPAPPARPRMQGLFHQFLQRALSRWISAP